MDAMRVGVVGAGLMGEVHARNVFGHAADAVVVAVADADGDRAGRLAAELGARAHTDGDELIRSADVDAVIVASPDQTHAGYALTCLAEGKPVLCEKPLADTVDDAWSVVVADAEASERAGRRLLQVGFMREFDPAHAAVRATVATGSIGRPMMFRGTHINPFPAAPTTAQRCITQSMIHDFHSARFLMGTEVVSVFSRWVPRATGDPTEVGVVTVSCSFEDGSVGLIDVNADSGYGYEVSAEITGARGVVSTVLPSLVAIRSAGAVATDVTPTWAARFAQAYQLELTAWLASLRSGVAVGPGAWEGYAANGIASAACLSVDSGMPEPVVLRPRPG